MFYLGINIFRGPSKVLVWKLDDKIHARMEVWKRAHTLSSRAHMLDFFGHSEHVLHSFKIYKWKKLVLNGPKNSIHNLFWSEKTDKLKLVNIA